MIIDFTMSSQIMNKINQEFHSIWELKIAINMQKNTSGQEYKVEHNINESIERLKYYSERWMYHARLFMNSIEEEMIALNNSIKKISSHTKISTFPLKQSAAYEFDAFLSTFGTILEGNIKEDLLNKLSSKRKQELEDVWCTKQKADSLFWRINVLRNRVVHADGAVFTTQGLRFQEFSSRIEYIKVDGLHIQFMAHLIDIKGNKDLYQLINDQIIEKTKQINKIFKTEKKEGMHSNCMPNKPDFFSVLFDNGIKQQNPYMAIVGHIDLVKTFNSIMEEISTFYTHMLAIITMELVEERDKKQHH